MINLTVNIDQKPDNEIPVSSNGMTEESILLRFFDLLEEANIKVTLYTTLEVLQEWKLINDLAENPMIEFGGKENDNLHTDWNKMWQEMEGNTEDFQTFKSWKIAKTLEMITAKTGKTSMTWREQNHELDQESVSMLTKYGVNLISNCNSASSTRPYWINENQLHYHVNIPSVVFNRRVPSMNQRFAGGDYQNGNIKVAVHQLTDQIIESIIVNQMECVPSNVLLNPIEMYKQDQFESLELDLINFLIEEETVHMSDIHTFELARLHYANRNN